MRESGLPGFGASRGDGHASRAFDQGNVGALIIRIGFGGVSYTIAMTKNPKNNRGNSQLRPLNPKP